MRRTKFHCVSSSTWFSEEGPPSLQTPRLHVGRRSQIPPSLVQELANFSLRAESCQPPASVHCLKAQILSFLSERIRIIIFHDMKSTEICEIKVSVSLNEVLLGYNDAHSFTYCLSLSGYKKWVAVTQPTGPAEPKIPSGPLQKRFAVPWDTCCSSVVLKVCSLGQQHQHHVGMLEM